MLMTKELRTFGKIVTAGLVQPRSPQSTEKPGTKQYDFEQTDTNLWICR